MLYSIMSFFVCIYHKAKPMNRNLLKIGLVTILPFEVIPNELHSLTLPHWPEVIVPIKNMQTILCPNVGTSSHTNRIKIYHKLQEILLFQSIWLYLGLSIIRKTFNNLLPRVPLQKADYWNELMKLLLNLLFSSLLFLIFNVKTFQLVTITNFLHPVLESWNKSAR